MALAATLVVLATQTAQAATPLALAACGGVLSERAGVPTIALEGYVLAGAFGAAVTVLAAGSTALGLACAALAGAALGGLFAASVLGLRAHAIVAGVAVNMLAAGGTRVALKVLYDSASNSPPLEAQRAAPDGSLAWVALREVLARPTPWLALLAVLGLRAALAHTVFGLRVHAAGEHAAALRSTGVSVLRVRASALVLGGALAGLGGAHLALSQREFVAYMSNGRGFLALAAVILGRWRPGAAGLAALGIGGLSALQAALAGSAGSYATLLQALPYAVTLAAVVTVVGRTRAPAELRG